MQLILTSPPKVMVILKEISFNCGSPDHLLGEWYNDPVSGSTSPPPPFNEQMPSCIEGHTRGSWFSKTASIHDVVANISVSSLAQCRSQPDIWSCKCKFFCVYRSYKESIFKEMNNDNDLICICMTKYVGLASLLHSCFCSSWWLVSIHQNHPILSGIT